MAGQAQQMNAAQQNNMARNAVTGLSVKRTQSIFRQVIDPATDNIVAIEPRNAGLILGFIVNITYNVAVALGGTPLTLTPFGAANSIKQFTFYDINNNTRIQTAGWHLAAINTARGARPYAGTDLDAGSTLKNYPAAYGRNNVLLESAPATIAAEANGDVAFSYYVPLAYSEKDLRGAIYAGLINATMSLQLNLNQQAVAARTLTGWSESVFATADAGTAPAGVTLGNMTVEVIQVYYDQLPKVEGGAPLLPRIDLATIYDIKDTSMTGITAGQDYSIPYSNFRDFLSTMTVYRNRVSADGFMNAGDITNFKLQTASYTNIFDVRERYAAMWNRQQVGLDLPLGVHIFSSREKPISTQMFGNMELIMNPSDAQTGANLRVGYESFALTQTISGASSLAGGAG